MKTIMGRWFVSWTSWRREDESQGLQSIQGKEGYIENNCSIASSKILLKQQKEVKTPKVKSEQKVPKSVLNEFV